jgi:hypothetical protein
MASNKSSSFSKPWVDRLGRSLMLLAGLSALAAFFSAIPAARASGPDVVWVETWRLFGFLIFSGFFFLLAFRPRKSAGVWELVFFHKAAMAVVSMVLTGARDAASAGMIDAILAAVILAAYLLTEGWKSWKT